MLNSILYFILGLMIVLFLMHKYYQRIMDQSYKDLMRKAPEDLQDIINKVEVGKIMDWIKYMAVVKIVESISIDKRLGKNLELMGVDVMGLMDKAENMALESIKERANNPNSFVEDLAEFIESL